MNKEELYNILRTISLEMFSADESAKPLPVIPDWSASLEKSGIDMFTAQEIFQILERRIPTKSFRVPLGLIERLQEFRNLGELCDFLLNKGFEKSSGKQVVYVDDEPDNLFIFKRRFGKALNLITFENPEEALDYIVRTPEVGLVITDEVMPKMNGNVLCDETKKVKPGMKFILITGNPNNDEDLMYHSLRKGRFYEFINKPVDFDEKGNEYLSMIQSLLDFDW